MHWSTTFAQNLIVELLFLINAILQLTEFLCFGFFKEATTQDLNIAQNWNLLLLEILQSQEACLSRILINLS